MVRVQPRLSRGDAFAIDGGKASPGAADVEPGRRRVTVYKAGAEVETRWLDVPALRLHARGRAFVGVRKTVTAMSRSRRVPRQNASDCAWLASCSSLRA